MMPHVSRRLVVAFALTLAVSTSALAQATPVAVAATPIDNFVPTGATRIGALEYRGGLALTSSAGDFGGWSGLVVDADGAGFVAVSDRGSWLTGRIESEGDRPTGISEARLAPMRPAGGGTLAGQRRGDVEALARVQGGFVVGIERAQEIWRFDGTDPLRAAGRKLLTDPGLSKLGYNEGPEALLAPAGGDRKSVV